MYLLYLDDSGSADNPADRHVVLAGVALFERQPHWFSERLDALAQRVWPDPGGRALQLRLLPSEAVVTTTEEPAIG